jgi:phage tail-like protein
MRRDVPGLATPYPLATLMPGYLQEDEFAVRLTTGLDDVLAPAVSVLDCLEAYLDPMLAPEDFLAWLGEWVGAVVDEHWPERVRRRAVLEAASRHRQRGTVAALRDLVATATGGEVEVAEEGGVSWSRHPTSGADGGPEGDQEGSPVGGQEGTAGWLRVRVWVDDPEEVRRTALEELVEGAKPAHVPHTLEVMAR